MNNSLVSVVIPSKDEPNLPNLIDELEFTLSKVYHEIVVVVGDRNRKLLPPLPSHVKVFKSYGDSLERAILLGFSVAKGAKIVVMDADGSHTPETVPKMVKALDSYEMVVASRFVEGSKFKTSPFRMFVTWFFNSYARLLGSTLSDPMSGFFGFRTEVLYGVRFKPFKWKTALELSNRARPSTVEVGYSFKAFTDKNRGLCGQCVLGLKILWDILEGAL